MPIGDFRRIPILFSIFVCSLSQSPEASADCGLEDQVLCQEQVRKIRACGKVVEVRTFCTNSDLPSITAAMKKEARDIPELQDDSERLNACVAYEEGCEALPDGPGGGQGADPEPIQANAAEEDGASEAFIATVTRESPETVKDAAALVMRRGWARSTLDYHMLYKVFHNKEFHGSAEGVALVSKEIVDKERAEQDGLAGLLEGLRRKFETAGDTRSMQATAIYENIAKSQSEMLAAVSCELGRMARINRERQEKLKSLVPMMAGGPEPDSGELKLVAENPNDSGLSGKSRAPASVSRVSKENSGRIYSGEFDGRFFMELTSDTGLSDLQPSLSLSSPSAANDDLDLFARVRKKYREHEEAGIFQQGLLD